MNEKQITEIILKHYPDVQAIYLFGTYGTEDEWPGSDVDIALLFPPAEAKEIKNLFMGECQRELESFLKKDVDLINVRTVSTVFQKEIIANGRLLYCADSYAVDEFEMLVLSYYQKLNEERSEILQSFYKTRRAYAV
ncbi:MAG: type VII toxin-antitoxin system MntA family adenylyltransferase antitoxin [Nitrospirota bacterium]